MFAVSKLCRLTKKEQEMISAEQKDKWDNLSTQDCAIKTGISIGIAKGRAEGRKDAILEVAKAFLSKGVPLNIVEASTGLSAAELQKLM